MQRARFWIICALGALILISGVLFATTRYFTLDKKSLKDMLPANVDMKLDNLTLSEAGAEDRSMIISASQAQYFKAQDLFLLADVRATVKTSRGDYKIAADKGRYEPGSRIVELSGNTRTIDTEGRVLLSKNLIFNLDQGFLTSPEDFCLTAPSMDLGGRNFIFDTKGKVLNVEGRVNLVIQP